jgi:hypothetical protein
MTLSLLKNKILKNPKKTAIFLVIIFGLVLIGIKVFSTKVTAQVIPVSVNISHLDFGTVFPGEELQGNFIVTYGTTGNGINYRIIQRPKPCPVENPTCGPGGYYKDLCPFLEKVNVDPLETDTEEQAFVGPNDLTDTWVVYFKVPAIMGHVSQDHTGGVVTEEGDYGCDIAIDIDIEDICNPTQNLVINGSFESPEVTDPTQWDIFPSGYSGLIWTVEWRSDIPASYEGWNRPAPALQELHEGVLGPAQEGDQYTELDSDWNGHSGSLNNEPASTKIYQDIPTIPGLTYNIKYYFSPRPSTTSANNVLEFSWDGVVKDTVSAAGGGTIIWVPKTYSFVATGNTTRIQFIDMGTADSLGTFLDNVSVMCQLPQP